MLHAMVASAIQREGLLSKGQAVLVAFSGGPDSLCLLHCLHGLGYRVHAAHLDHALRSESGSEAQAARELAEGMGIPITLGRRAKPDPQSSIEAAARMDRYRFLRQTAHDQNLQVIATGHTADDQAETVLMHLLRGAGPTGSSGIRMKADLGSIAHEFAGAGMTLIRPLLGVTQEETRAHCRQAGLQPLEDPSNLDERFFRNRVRHHLLPILEKYNPRVRESLARFASITAAEADFIQAQVEVAMSQALILDEHDQVVLRRDVVSSLPLAIQRGLVRHVARRLRPSLRELDFTHTEAAVEYCSADSQGLLQLGHGVELRQRGDRILFRAAGTPTSLPEFPQLCRDEPLPLDAPGEFSLQAGWGLTAHVVGAEDDLLERASPDDVAVFDGAVLQERLTLGAPQSGDRIQPLGMQGSRKLSDVFIDCKIPREARAHWPVLRGGDEILWVVALRVSEIHKLLPSSKKALLLELERPRVERQ